MAHRVLALASVSSGRRRGVEQRRLVLPTAEFFPKFEETDHARAEAVLARVKQHMGMAEWPCLLVERNVTNGRVAEYAFLQSKSKTAATFGFVNNEAAITYKPDLVDRPYEIISTFAHELSHYRLHDTLEKPPGADVEPMLEELATELAVAFHGFALMSANAAFSFEQTQYFGGQGWKSSRLGYFSEDGWVFALAVFLALKDESPEPARKHLKPHLAKKLDAAMKRLAGEPALLEPLRNAPHR